MVARPTFIAAPCTSPFMSVIVDIWVQCKLTFYEDFVISQIRYGLFAESERSKSAFVYNVPLLGGLRQRL